MIILYTISPGFQHFEVLSCLLSYCARHSFDRANRLCRFSGKGQDANPTHDKDGNELSGGALKKGKSKADSARKQRAFYEKQVAERGPHFLEKLRAEVNQAQQEYEELAKQLSNLDVGSCNMTTNGSAS